VPDAEIEELPHSVAIDFASGSGMQFASDDRAGQINVLNSLRDAHQTHGQ
jgi:hypothetical protein